jgi:MFS family permease
VLRWLAGRRRTTSVALAATAWAACWAVVVIGGHLGSGLAAEAAFVVAMAVFALGETLFSPTLPAIINDLAPPEAAGRYNGLGVLAFTTGFLLGPTAGTAALPSGGVLFTVLIAACLGAAAMALRLGQRLGPDLNTIEVPATTGAGPGEVAEPDDPARPRPALAPEVA